MRKSYDLNCSKLTHDHTDEVFENCDCTEEKETKATKKDTKKAKDEVVLFTTKTCPNCKMAKSLLDKANIKYTVVDAEEQKELTKEKGS